MLCFADNRDKSFKRATIKSVHSRELSDIVIRGSDIRPIDLIGQGKQYRVICIHVLL